jgi:CarboxypepD_reg-like domain
MRYLQLTFLCLVSSACVPAVVTNSPGAYGRVVDAQTHAPLAHASVSFAGRSPTVTTNAEGLYDLPHTTKVGIVVLLPFEFQTLPLQVSHIGYRTATLRIPAISEHKRQDVALERQESSKGTGQ